VPCDAVIVKDLWCVNGACCPVVMCPGVWYWTVCYVGPGWMFAVSTTVLCTADNK